MKDFVNKSVAMLAKKYSGGPEDSSDYRQGGVKVYSSLDYKAANAQTQNSLVHDARFTEDNYRTILGRLLCLLLANRLEFLCYDKIQRALLRRLLFYARPLA